MLKRTDDLIDLKFTAFHCRWSRWLVSFHVIICHIQLVECCLSICGSFMPSQTPSVVGPNISAETDDASRRFCRSIHCLFNRLVDRNAEPWDCWTGDTDSLSSAFPHRDAIPVSCTAGCSILKGTCRNWDDQHWTIIHTFSSLMR